MRTIKARILRWFEQKLHYSKSDLKLYSCFYNVRCFSNIFVIVLCTREFLAANQWRVHTRANWRGETRCYESVYRWLQRRYGILPWTHQDVWDFNPSHV